MKQFFYSSALCLAAALAPSLQAQTVLFSEDFQGGMPATFSLYNVDMRTPAGSVAFVNQAWIVRDDPDRTIADSVAISTSWYAPDGAADDWMVSPAITIPTGLNIQLTWEAIAFDADFRDGYEVRIFTAAPTDSTLANSTLALTIAAENDTWTQRSLNLSAYAGQTIYVAFRNKSNNMFLLAIDNIVVATVPNYDLKVVNVLPNNWQYSAIPLAQYQPDSLFASVQNIGALASTNAGVSLNIIGINNLAVLSSVSATVPILAATATSAPLSLGMLAPTVGDTYALIYTPIADSTDANQASDTIINVISIDDRFARHQGNIVAASGFGEAGAYIGISVTVRNPQPAAAIHALMTQDFTGNRLAGLIFATDANGTPTRVVAATDTITVATLTTPTLLSMPFSNAPNLAAGTYVVVVIELDSELSLGFTNNIFRTGTTWASSPTTPWDNLENFGFEVVPMIQLQMNTTCDGFTASTIATGTSSGAAADGTATYNTVGGTAPITYTWSNNQTTATATGLAMGTYYVTATDANGCVLSDSASVNLGTSVAVIGLDNIFNVFPNPITNTLHLEANWGYTTNARLSVVAADGRIMFRQTINAANQAQIEINTTDFAAGVYFVQIHTDKEVLTRRIVKN
jgi:hypothetical protein